MKEMSQKLQKAKYVVLDGYDYGIHFLAPEAVTAACCRALQVALAADG